MKMSFFLLGVFWVSSLNATSYSSLDDGNYIQQLLEEADEQGLHESSYWLALGHYRKNSYGHRFESYTDDPAFFLSPQGKHSPREELQATLKAIFAKVATADGQGEDQVGDQIDGQIDSHAQCRFVARFRWLVASLNIDSTKLPSVVCEAYSQWRNAIQADSITLIFASHYVNNPSSMYGHTLLRIDPPKGGTGAARGAEWLSYAVNFGANITSNDNSILYAWRGLTGGYPGGFSMEPYYRKVKQYGSMENRGLWEYKLDLTQEEVDRLVTHLWELKGINFDYYFFDENCSFRLLELLEIARPDVDLLTGFEYKAIPTDTVRVVKANHLISEQHYRDSHIEEIKHISGRLTAEQRKLAKAIAENPDMLDSDEFQTLAQEQQRLLVFVAYQYLRYQQRRTQRDTSMAKRSHRLLLAMNQLQAPSQPPSEPPADPIEGHKTTLMAVGAGEQNQQGFMDLHWRVSYHDTTDPLPGYPLGLGIEMMGVTLRQWDDDRLTLERLDLVGISSLAMRDSLFKPLSWRIDSGLERVYSAVDDNEENTQLVAHLTGGGGLSHSLSSSWLSYTLLTGRYEYNTDYSNNHQLGFGAAVGVLGALGKSNLSLEWGLYELTNGVERASLLAKWNYALSINHSLRLELEATRTAGFNDESFKLSYRRFF